MTRRISLPARPEPITVTVGETALIVVDMQNAYCSKGGYLDLVGFDVSGVEPVIAETAAVIAACKAAGILAIWLQNGFTPGRREAGAGAAPVWHKSHALRAMRESTAFDGKLITHGTWDHAIVDAVAPAPGDIVVPKARYSGFAGTALDQILRAHGIRTTLICGVATNVCVESTLRDAYHHDYFPVMVTDATKAIGEGQQEATEYNVAKFFGWLTTGAELRGALRANAGA